MKRYFITLLFVCLCQTMFAGPDQFRTKLDAKEKADSLKKAIIAKQDSLILIDQQILKMAPGAKNADVLKKQSDTLADQLKVLKKVQSMQPAQTESAEIQSTTLSIATLVFGVVLILIVLLFKSASQANTFPIYKLIGIMFIGTVSVFLIPAGFDNAQITPVVGLLGTLAGYLAGSNHSANTGNTTTQPK